MKNFVTTLAIVTGLYHMIVVGGVFARLGIFISPVTHRAISLSLAIILIFLLFPARKGRKGVFWYDIILIILGVVPLSFIAIFGEEINNYVLMGTLDLKGTIFAFALLITLLEGCRRASEGYILPALLLLVLLVTMFGNYMPGILHTLGFQAREMGFILYVGVNGFFGIPMRVAASIIILYVVFSQVLLEIGGSDWFINLALSLVGKMKGGAAKASVVASALFGTISGSPSGNAAAIGTITIPLMKKAGYTPEFAAGVEAVASTGGQIMPPVMAAVAFVIAEWLSIRYIDVCLAASVPAVLYFAALFYGVDIEARKRNLSGITDREIQSFGRVIRGGWYYILPLAVLIYALVFLQYPAEMSAFVAIVAILILSIFINRQTKKLALPGSIGEVGIRLSRVILSIGSGTRMWIRVALICASVGILIGSLIQSGIALKTASFIIQFSGGQLFLVLLLTAAAAYILGMGLDTLPLYITLAILIAPALTKMGVAPIGAHLFVLFWGLTSFFTPPVCIAVYITSSIAQSGIWRTGFEAMRLGIVIFVVPFAFVYLPAIILPAPAGDFMIAFVKTLFASIGIVGGMTGFLVKKANWMIRVVLAVGGVMLLFPGWQIPVIGVAMVLAMGLVQWFTRKQRRVRPA